MILKAIFEFLLIETTNKHLATQQIIYSLITAPPYLGGFTIVSSPLLMQGKVVHKAKRPSFPLNVFNVHKANSLIFFF